MKVILNKSVCRTGMLVFIFSFLISSIVFSQIKLPKLVSDGMVLQRNIKIKIWGWASKNENISVHFMNSTYNTTADDSGNWNVMLPEVKAGGPYKMAINSDKDDSITIKNIMIGDVWVCSGQSNMEHTMGSFDWVYPDVIGNSMNKYIREFNVPETYNFMGPQKDFISGKWEEANPTNILNWSAVAYFFGKDLYDKYKIPIGLINSSLGGSPIESWLSASALKKFPKYYNEALMFKDSSLIKKIETADNARIDVWYKLSWEKDKGYADSGNIWTNPSLNTSDWSTMNVPGYWADTKLGPVNGVIWFRKKVNIPSSMVGKPAKIILGRIVDADSVFINGSFVGTTTYLYPRRRYDIAPNILKTGENTVVIRVISNIGRGGFVLDKPYEITAGNQSVSLKGEWKYRLGDEMPPLMPQTFIRWKPEGLYNAMLAPLLNMRIKGVIWYQGESNADRPIEYKKLFPALIRNWREKWNQGDFPFLYVQLPNFMEPKKQPSESNWVLLREAQLETLSLPNTGMAVTIDIGEWNDVHPVDKKDVGKRLALAAEKIAYGDNNIVYSGPIYKSMKIDGNKITISFMHTDSGLMAKGNSEPGCFAIAGKDMHFVWAKAKIVGNKVVVWSNHISYPVAVRYAWADDPVGAKLYNDEGLPASPFRTDDWPAKQ
jgi:sialate O-acetylesterase